MLWLIKSLIWWGTAALLIGIDSSRRRKKVDRDPSNPDLSDKSVGPWLIVAAVAGSLVFPFYFYSTRKTATAALVGVLLIPVFLALVYGLTLAIALGLSAIT